MRSTHAWVYSLPANEVGWVGLSKLKGVLKPHPMHPSHQICPSSTIDIYTLIHAYIHTYIHTHRHTYIQTYLQDLLEILVLLQSYGCGANDFQVLYRKDGVESENAGKRYSTCEISTLTDLISASLSGNWSLKIIPFSLS